MRVITGLPELESLVGDTLGMSAWRVVSQAEIGGFADLTGDRQWIHTNPERARSGPFGATVAHGFFVLSLVPVLANEVFTVERVTARINYGLERVRFPQPLKAGERVRSQVEIVAFEATASGAKVHFRHTLGSDGSAKPVCIAETITLFVQS